MKYRRLGDSGLEISELALGSWLTYGVGVQSDKARACLDAAFDVGINFIDTSNSYGRGAAETFLGAALKSRPRDSYIIATKLYFPMTDTDFGLSRAQVEKQLDASLKRLQTDVIDLYQCHRYDGGTPLDETMEALTRAVESGKVRYIGFSEWPADKIREAIELSKSRGFTKFVSSQPQYSLVWREPEEEVIPRAMAITAPTMFLVGTTDVINEIGAQNVYAMMTSPRIYLEITGAGHFDFVTGLGPESYKLLARKYFTLLFGRALKRIAAYDGRIVSEAASDQSATLLTKVLMNQ